MAQPFSAAQSEGVVVMERGQAAATQGDLVESAGCISPGRWWGQGRRQGVLTHAATPASLSWHPGDGWEALHGGQYAGRMGE